MSLLEDKTEDGKETKDNGFNGENETKKEKENKNNNKKNDLLRMVYELPTDFDEEENSDQSKDCKKDIMCVQNEGIGYARVHLEERANKPQGTFTNALSLKDMMESNNALGLNRALRGGEGVQFVKSSEISRTSDANVINCTNQTINVTKCPSVERNSDSAPPSPVHKDSLTLVTLPGDFDLNGDKNSYCGSPLASLSPKPSMMSASRNHSLSIVDGAQSDISDEELENLNKVLTAKPGLLEKWLREKANPDTLRRVHAISEPHVINAGSKRTSVTSELFQMWLASSPVKVVFICYII